MEQRTRVIPPARGIVRPPSPPSFSDMDAAQKQGLVIPEATGGGGQVGRVPPAVRKITAQYEAVDLETASARRAARLKGTLPPIAGGLDGPGEAQDGTHPVGTQPADAPDAAPGPAAPDLATLTTLLHQLVGKDLAAKPKPPSDEAMETLLNLLKLAAPRMQQSAQLAQQEIQPHLDPFNPPPLVPRTPAAQPNVAAMMESPKPAPLDDARTYLTKRSRVSFTVPGGTYSVPAVDVQTCAAGLVILLPVDAQSATFVPSLGAEVTVEYEGRSWDCFFPGVAAHIAPLGVQMLGFVYQNDRQATNGKA